MDKKTISAIVLTVVITGGAVGVIYWVATMKPEADTLEVYHWWTSGGEEDAITALLGVFTALYPNTTIIATPVTGGAGYTFLTAIKTMALSGELPDSFQMHAGYEGQPYIDANLLKPIDDLWTSKNLTGVIPAVVQDMCKFGTKFYSVPVNIHRTNVVWYSRNVTTAAGVDVNNLTTWAGFFDACDKVKAAIPSITKPIAMGEAWTAAHVFEQIMASEGIGFYQDWVNGKVTSATNTTLLDALIIFQKYLTYVNTDNTNMHWDTATGKIITNASAFNIMGDWANGEFLKAYGANGFEVEYNVTMVPGTNDMYGLCIDCFETPVDAKHPTNSRRWLEVVSSQAGQDAFNPLKGSISARTDANMSKYGLYQQAASANFKAVTHMYPSVVHGSGAPEAFKVGLQNIMSAFVGGTKTLTETAEAIVALTTSQTWTKVWNFA